MKKIALNKKSRTRDSSSKLAARKQPAETPLDRLPLKYLTLMNLKKYLEITQEPDQDLQPVAQPEANTAKRSSGLLS